MFVLPETCDTLELPKFTVSHRVTRYFGNLPLDHQLRLRCSRHPFLPARREIYVSEDFAGPDSRVRAVARRLRHHSSGHTADHPSDLGNYFAHGALDRKSV